MRLSNPSLLTIVSCCLLGAVSLRQPCKTVGDITQELERLSAEYKPSGIRGSAFLDLEAAAATAAIETAHAGLWKALASSKIKHEGLNLNEDPMPTGLSITANGVPLPWDSNRRPGRVNPTRLVLTVRGERFEEVLQRGGRIEISLVKKGWIWSESYKPDENILSCTDGSTTDCVNGGFAVAYFEVPEKSKLMAKLKVKVPGEADLAGSWLIETADSGSGDA
mmetsp:Transcript_42303/g.88389  ORF Transcript_42303/g.88389 Transcript_42303/m.88389 type:complete len:222 (-) Transcript_42303:106-771(-)